MKNIFLIILNYQNNCIGTTTFVLLFVQININKLKNIATYVLKFSNIVGIIITPKRLVLFFTYFYTTKNDLNFLKTAQNNNNLFTVL